MFRILWTYLPWVLFLAAAVLAARRGLKLADANRRNVTLTGDLHACEAALLKARAQRDAADDNAADWAEYSREMLAEASADAAEWQRRYEATVIDPAETPTLASLLGLGPATAPDVAAAMATYGTFAEHTGAWQVLRQSVTVPATPTVRETPAQRRRAAKHDRARGTGVAA